MQKKRYIIRTMGLKEVDIAIEWAAKEGWNPGNHDAECYFEADPNGFLIGMLAKNPLPQFPRSNMVELLALLDFILLNPNIVTGDMESKYGMPL